MSHAAVIPLKYHMLWHIIFSGILTVLRLCWQCVLVGSRVLSLCVSHCLSLSLSVSLCLFLSLSLCLSLSTSTYLSMFLFLCLCLSLCLSLSLSVSLCLSLSLSVSLCLSLPLYVSLCLSLSLSVSLCLSLSLCVYFCLSLSVSLSTSTYLSMFLFSLSLSLSVCLSLSLSVSLSLPLSASLCLSLSLSVSLSVSLCLSLSLYVSLCLSLSLSVSLCLSLSLSVSLCLSLSLSVSLSVSLCLSRSLAVSLCLPLSLSPPPLSLSVSLSDKAAGCHTWVPRPDSAHSPWFLSIREYGQQYSFFDTCMWSSPYQRTWSLLSLQFIHKLLWFRQIVSSNSFPIFHIFESLSNLCTCDLCSTGLHFSLVPYISFYLFYWLTSAENTSLYLHDNNYYLHSSPAPSRLSYQCWSNFADNMFRINIPFFRQPQYFSVLLGSIKVFVQAITDSCFDSTSLTLETLKWETFATDVSMKLGSLLSGTCRHHCFVHLWNSTVNRWSWIPRAGSLKLC